MHIHSYQIHNVLNVYRKQLSRGTTWNLSGETDGNNADQDRSNLSDHGQRQSLFEKISSEIVQRITQFGPDIEIEAAFSGQSADTRERVRDKTDPSSGKNPVFSYTMIDNNNQKTTHNFSIRQLNYSGEKVKSLITAPSDSKSDSGLE